MNAAEQHRTVFIQTQTENRKGQGYYRVAKVDNGSKKMVNLKHRKYIALVFYYYPVKCVSLVLLLSKDVVFVRITVHYFNYSNSDRPTPRIQCNIQRC